MVKHDTLYFCLYWPCIIL